MPRPVPTLPVGSGAFAKLLERAGFTEPMCFSSAIEPWVVLPGQVFDLGGL